jgi:signal transduction histidine kinase/CheY-like chemotaxis protein
MKKSLISVNLRFEQDVVLARQRARDIAQLLGFDHSEQIRLATATSEIARNAFRYARSGRVEFQLETSAPARLLIRVSDSGSGIHNLDEILEGRYRSTTGLGKGIAGTRRLMDQFEIQTGSTGTLVEMSKMVPQAAFPLHSARVEEIAQKLAQRRPENPYEEVERQNQELLKTLAELRSRQDELLELNRELEDTNRGVVALYAELDDRADALRRMSDAKTSFLSNMSHEFRTPLNSILSLSQMLMQRLDGDLTEEQERQISYIRGSAQALHEMVNDLLDIAKVEAGKVEVKAREFEVEDLFGALRGMLKPILQTTSVNLVFEEPVDLPTMFTDEGKISQILRNFISNAIKFTERGEVRVTAAKSEAKTICFSVADTGIGIAPQDRDRIFDEFVQVQSQLQKKAKGTGLGLPLSRNLAHLLGGRVTLDSKVGAGSTFSVYVPVVFPGVSAQKEGGIPQVDPDRLPVVLIEDNRETAFVICKLLEDTEFQILEAHTMERGLELLAALHPAAVILDVLMDGESSWSALKQIRARDVPVISISVVGSEQAKAIAMGASAFLHKPVSRDALLKALRSINQCAPLRKVLLVEDNDVARYSLRELLGSARLEIVEASSGREGLRLALEVRPDAIFLDLLMPDMSGIEVLRELRAGSVAQEIPVVIHSSKDLSEDEKLDLRLPLVTFLPKRATAGPDARDRLSQALAVVGFSIEPLGEQHA